MNLATIMDKNATRGFHEQQYDFTKYDFVRPWYGAAQLTACANKEADTGGSPINVDADGDGQTTADGDCDDNNPNINSNAIEFCDELDNNCDGNIDEDVTLLWYEDADGDGYGNLENTQEACLMPEGYAVNPQDCNDTDAEIHPEAPRIVR